MARQPGNRRRALVLTSVAFADVIVRGPEATVINKISRCLCQMTNSCETTFGGKSQRSDVYSSCLPNIAKDDPSLAPTPMKIHYLAP